MTNLQKDSKFTGSDVLVFSTNRFFLLFVAGLIILLARRPEGIFSPQFFAEDGTIFFKDAYQLQLYQALISTHAGYHNLLPRLVAELATLFPLSYSPFLYNAISLLIASFCLSWIYLPHFRHLVVDDRARLVLALLYFLLPNQEMLMKLSYVQWYLLFWATLCCFMRLPNRCLFRILLVIANLIAFWTAAISFILLPIWMIRIVYSKDKRAKIMSASIFLAGCSALLANCLPGLFALEGASVYHIGLMTKIHGLLNGIAYKAICSTILGSEITYWLFQNGQMLIYLVSFVLLFLILGMASTLKERLPVSIWGLIYVIISSLGCFLLRPSFLGSLANGTGVRSHDRYFFLATNIFYLTVFVIGTRFQKRFYPSTRNKIIVLSIICALIIVQLAGFRMPQWTRHDLHWDMYAKLITINQEKAIKEKSSRELIIPINPIPWKIQLVIEPEKIDSNG